MAVRRFQGLFSVPRDATPPARRLLRGARAVLQQAGYRPEAGALIVAISGGADSSAALHAVATLAARWRERIVGAWFDHRMRGGAASHAERAAVRRLSEHCGVRLREGAANMPLRSEAAARMGRYRWLGELARAEGAAAVVTGHTYEDQVETVILRLLRGAGLAGLRGMAAVDPWPLGEGPPVLRPLLRSTHAEVLAYCDAAGIRHVEDETNRSERFLRNRVRWELRPLLRELNSGAERHLVAVAEEARDAYRALLDAAGLDPRAEALSCAALRSAGPAAGLAATAAWLAARGVSVDRRVARQATRLAERGAGSLAVRGGSLEVRDGALRLVRGGEGDATR